jgi:predicted nucleic acid-binding protein
MKLVIDASVAMAWFVRQSGQTDCLWMLEDVHELLVPDLVYPEVANGIWRLVRGNILKREQGLQIVGQMTQTMDRVFPCAALIQSAMEISLELNHPAYDCFYLALAAKEEIQMGTLDMRLLNKLKQTPYAGLAVHPQDLNP